MNDQKNIQMQDAMTQDIAGQGEGDDPASGDNPFKTPPKEGEKLTIGFSALFAYRKAIRTFLNEVKMPNN